MKAAHQQAEAAEKSDIAQQQQEQVCQQSLNTEATSLLEPRQSSVVARAHSPDAVLATVCSLQEVQAGPSSNFTHDKRTSAEACVDSPASPVVASPEHIAEEHVQASELAVASTSKRRKRKQSAVGENLIASDSKRRHSSTAQLRQTDSPIAGGPAAAHGPTASLHAASDTNESDDDLQDQPGESLTLADSMDMSSPHAVDQPQELPVPIISPQPPATLHVESVLESSGAPAADTVADTALNASPVNARNSDYQDAQERLSSPLHVSPDPARSEEEQPAGPSVTSVHEDEHQAAAPSLSFARPPAGLSPPDSPQDQDAKVLRHSLVALDQEEALPNDGGASPEPDTSAAAKAEVASSAAATGFDAPDADSNMVLQTHMGLALGTAAAVPLPTTGSIQRVHSVHTISTKTVIML